MLGYQIRIYVVCAILCMQRRIGAHQCLAMIVSRYLPRVFGKSAVYRFRKRGVRKKSYLVFYGNTMDNSESQRQISKERIVSSIIPATTHRDVKSIIKEGTGLV
jgi:hypothetical protein